MLCGNYLRPAPVFVPWGEVASRMDQKTLRIDDRDYLLLHIEPCGPRRLRLFAAEPLPRLRDRVHYLLWDGHTREPVRGHSFAPSSCLEVTRSYA